MKLITALLAAATLAVAGPAFAHSDEYLDSITTPHGGQMRMAGFYHFELVVEPSALTVYVTDHAGEAIATATASGSATLLVGGKRSTIALAPAGDNRLTGKGEFAMDPAMRVVLSITMPGQAAEQARFTPLAPRPAQPVAVDHGNDDHHHH